MKTGKVRQQLLQIRHMRSSFICKIKQHWKRVPAIFYLLIEAASLVLNFIDKGQLSFRVASLILATFAFGMTIGVCFLERNILVADRQIGFMDLASSGIQFIGTLLTAFGVKNFNNYDVSVLLLLNATIAAVFMFLKDEKAFDHSTFEDQMFSDMEEQFPVNPYGPYQISGREDFHLRPPGGDPDPLRTSDSSIIPDNVAQTLDPSRNGTRWTQMDPELMSSSESSKASQTAVLVNNGPSSSVGAPSDLLLCKSVEDLRSTVQSLESEKELTIKNQSAEIEALQSDISKHKSLVNQQRREIDDLNSRLDALGKSLSSSQQDKPLTNKSLQDTPSTLEAKDKLLRDKDKRIQLLKEKDSLNESSLAVQTFKDQSKTLKQELSSANTMVSKSRECKVCCTERDGLIAKFQASDSYNSSIIDATAAPDQKLNRDLQHVRDEFQVSGDQVKAAGTFVPESSEGHDASGGNNS
ncbi:uncharacterized protein LOC116121505 isoform X3 [Pistacia vera]|uniref:uncharacterized protein LOC116121505 isoform X3 n=1 Tax=Pistacia vera TaxID=55513 RepID=UPI001263C597|nr:uncharacterized protein LOC116121505 isoform X3 [Pistacia vera]